MSSIVGHTAVGAAIYLAGNRSCDRDVHWALPVLVLLSVLPDVDYILNWGLHIGLHSRVSHSLVFSLVVSGLAWYCSVAIRRTTPHAPSLQAILLASLSHPVLDVLVGVHPLPLFWPLAQWAITSPVGLLPSAGGLSLFNYYLWRNLLIELGVLVPVLAALVSIVRGTNVGAFMYNALVIFPAWLVFLFWSISLSR